MRHALPIITAAAILLTGCAVPAAEPTGWPTAGTVSAAKAAVSSKAPAGTVSQRNALRKAESYLKLKGFSRKGLIQQLSSDAGDGFTKAQATYAADKLGL